MIFKVYVKILLVRTYAAAGMIIPTRSAPVDL
jgi:hypothetical protein